MRIALRDYEGVIHNSFAPEEEGCIIKSIFLQQISGDQAVWIEYTDGSHLTLDARPLSRFNDSIQHSAYVNLPAIRTIDYLLDLGCLYIETDTESNRLDHTSPADGEPFHTSGRRGYVTFEDNGWDRYTSSPRITNNSQGIDAVEFSQAEMVSALRQIRERLAERAEADREGEETAERF